MKIKIKLFLLILLLPALIFSQEQTEFVPGQIIVHLHKQANIQTLAENFTNINLVPIKLLSKRMNIWLCEYDQTKIDTEDILFAVRQNSSVKIVQFNHYVKLREDIDSGEPDHQTSFRQTLPNDPQFGQQWALNNTGQTGGTPDADIDAPEAWDLYTGGLTALGDEVVIAIVDGGCDLSHQDLPLWKNIHEIPNNGIDDDNNGYIDDYDGWNAYNSTGNVPSNSHGTHVSGIAGAIGNNSIGVTGINWVSKIMPVAGSSTTESVVVEAYGYVLEMRTRYNETNGDSGAFVVVTNSSFGVDLGQPANYPIWCAMYDSMGVQGILSCAATANANWDIDVVGDVPTACPSDYLISVTNTTHNDVKNSGAAYGLTTIDLGSPGTNILSTLPGNSYGNLTGTSMATPQVAGAVALMIASANNGLIQSYKNNPASVALLFKQFLLDATDPISSLQGITVTGGRLNLYNALLYVFTEPDTIAPSQVTDLSILSATSNSLTLTWTAPYDTSRNGVVAYDLRYSLNPILNDNDFNNATMIDYPYAPADSGQTENFEVTGLDISTTYYFAMKSMDLWSNASLLSNSAQGITWNAPVISVSPDSLGLTLTPQQVFNDSLIISNISSNSSTLDYELSVENNTFPGNGELKVRVVPLAGNSSTQTQDKNNQIDYGGISFDGFGGPDDFGYEWIDSDEPNGPAYVWDDISSTGTEITNWTPTSSFDPKDEGISDPIPIGFDFKFYGTPYNQIYVSSNGFLTFSSFSSNTYTNSQIPDASIPNNIIAAFWDDLDGSSQGAVYYLQDGNKFIIQFNNWQHYPSTGSVTFQVVLFSTGKITIYYNSLTEVNSSTTGIENADGTVGLEVAYNSNYIHNNLALQISAEPDWLIVNNISGTIYNANSAVVEVTFQSGDYTFGSYTADIVISSNDPVTPQYVISVTMEIVPLPVELANFTAFQNNEAIILNWTTATEINNSGFEIQKKLKGEDWQVVTFVEGKGNSAEPSNYSYSDPLERKGIYSYRLKQIDYDGGISFSSEVEINIEGPENYSLFQNYPNPFNPNTKIKFAVPFKSSVKLHIYNSLGELVTTIANGIFESGYFELNWNAVDYASGIYFYSIEAKSLENPAEFRDVMKMILIK